MKNNYIYLSDVDLEACVYLTPCSHAAVGEGAMVDRWYSSCSRTVVLLHSSGFKWLPGILRP